MRRSAGGCPDQVCGFARGQCGRTGEPERLAEVVVGRQGSDGNCGDASPSTRPTLSHVADRHVQVPVDRGLPEGLEVLVDPVGWDGRPLESRVADGRRRPAGLLCPMTSTLRQSAAPSAAGRSPPPARESPSVGSCRPAAAGTCAPHRRAARPRRRDRPRRVGERGKGGGTGRRHPGRGVARRRGARSSPCRRARRWAVIGHLGAHRSSPFFPLVVGRAGGP